MALYQLKMHHLEREGHGPKHGEGEQNVVGGGIEKTLLWNTEENHGRLWNAWNLKKKAGKVNC